MRFVQILPWTNGDNTRWVDGFMAAVIVGADVVKIDRFGNPRHLVDVAQETIQVHIIADAMLIAFKVGDIDRIETYQRCPQTNIGFCQSIAGEVAMLAKDLLNALQRLKDFLDRLVVSFLAGGKPGLVNTVIDVVVNPAIQLINFFPQFSGIIIARPRAVSIKSGMNMRIISADSLLTMVWFFLSHSTGTVTRPV